MTASSPRPAPVPMRASPPLRSTASTSAKSPLMMPGFRIRSAMPRTPWMSTPSATRKASFMVTRASQTFFRRSLLTTMTVSAVSRRLDRPDRARSPFLRPSQAKGVMTTATVRAPSSRA